VAVAAGGGGGVVVVVVVKDKNTAQLILFTFFNMYLFPPFVVSVKTVITIYTLISCSCLSVVG